MVAGTAIALVSWIKAERELRGALGSTAWQESGSSLVQDNAQK
jgi:hypothetical protein